MSKRVSLFLERQTMKTADVAVTTNESHREIAMKRAGVLKERSSIVRTGPDFERL